MARRLGRGRVLLAVARESVENLLLGTPLQRWSDGWLSEPGATFVTLRLGGALRGCIGTLVAERPLLEDLRRNARAAASRDPRFLPLAVDELPGVRLEVSLLSPLEPLPCRDEADALARLRPGRDGVCLEWRRRRGTFLPQVWEQLAEPALFLRALKEKAGLAQDFWHPDVRLWRYRVSKWVEEA